MNRLDSYLKEISPLLPKAQRQDILAEIEDDLRSQFEDRGEELGRDLTDQEQDAILERFGPVLMVAGRYLPQEGTLTFGRVLIGPEIFPFYIRYVRFFVAAALVVAVGVRVAMGLMDPANWDGALSSIFFYPALMFAIQTVVWIGLQKHFEANPEKWKPKEKEKNVERVSRFDSTAQLVIQVLLTPVVPYFLAKPGGPSDSIILTQPWNNIYIPAMVMAVASIAQSVATLINPEWVRLRNYVQMASGALVVALCGYLLASGPLVRVNATSAKRADAEILLQNSMTWSVAAVGVVVLIMTILEARKSFSGQALKSVD